MQPVTIILLLVFAMLVGALISAGISQVLLRIWRVEKPRFWFLSLAIGSGVVAGLVAGVVAGVVNLRGLTVTGILTQATVIYLTNLLVTSLVIRTQVAHSARGWAASVLPWAVVLAILLYYLTAPVLGLVRERDKRLTCASHLRQIGLVLQIYAEDHDGKLPESVQSLNEYSMIPELFVCPATSSSQYEYDPEATLDARGVVMWDRLGNHKEGRNVLFGNGRVEWLTEEEFQAERSEK
jgi:hypothetical protein